jgi:predicted aspartyl protease
MKKIYKLEKHGSLLMARTFIEGGKGKAYPKLLIDTGSAYTIVSKELLEFIGSSPAAAAKRQRIITGSGYEIVPVVSIETFSCFGKTLKDFSILGHTLPFGVYVDGLLGMDFLGRFDIEIKTKSGEIILR